MATQGAAASSPLGAAATSSSAAGFQRAEPMELAFRDIVYTVAPPRPLGQRIAAAFQSRDAAAAAAEKHRPTEILHGISGYVESGHCLAIMGASGAGKSSLMDVLAGRQKEGVVTGQITVNGRPVPRNFNRLSGYVMQDDVLLGMLTVTETLMYSHALRMPKDVHEREGAATVQSILQILNLRKVANSRVGTPLSRGISGGERRRLNIGAELVTSPSLLFLDEPTSGLDARNALNVMRSILRLCRVTGRTVVCTIHQPRSNVFAMFDRLLLLDRGHTVYFGPAKDAVAYFGRLGFVCPQFANPADYLLDLLEDAVEARDASAALRDATAATAGTGSNNSRHEEEEEEDDEAADGDIYGGASADKLASGASPLRSVDFPAEYRRSELAAATLAWLDERQPRQPAIDAHSASLAGLTTSSTLTEGLLAGAAARSAGYKPVNYAGDDDVGASGGSPSAYAVSTWRQLAVLTSRTWLATVRDPAVMWVRTIAALAIALLVGIIFFDLPDDEAGIENRINTILFVMCVFSLFCLPAIGKYIEDRALFIRERAGGYYSTIAYFLATFVVEFPILVTIVLLYSVVCYWMVGLYPDATSFALFLATVTLVINVGFSLSQFVAASVSTLTMAVAVYMIVLVYSLLTGGFIVSPDNLPEPLQWLVFTSYFYYGFESLMIIEFQHRDYDVRDPLDEIGFDEGNLARDLSLLAVFFVAFRVAAYIMLAYFQRERR